MGFDLEDLDEVASMLSNDYYGERKKWKDLTFGTCRRKRKHFNDED